jgi:hypothetical protein
MIEVHSFSLCHGLRFLDAIDFVTMNLCTFRLSVYLMIIMRVLCG